MMRFGIVMVLLTSMATSVAAQTKFTYPETKKIDHVDDYHGVKVADPYRWLENDVRESEEVKSWVEAQNKVTFGYLSTLPYRESIEKKLTDLWNYEKFSVPFKEGGRYFLMKNNGLQNQFVLYTMKDLKETPKVLLDPNTWSKDGTVALNGYSISRDGRYIAYAVADAGSDWMIWRIRDIETGKELSDEIRWTKWSGTSWTADSKGFFYSRYPEPAKGAAYQSLNLNQKLYYHRVGTPQSEDVVVFQRPDQPEWGYSGDVTEDGRYLVISVWKGTDERNLVFVRDLQEPYSSAIPIIETFDNGFIFAGNVGTKFFFRTDLDAPKKRVIAIDIMNPAKENWKEIVPQTESTLFQAAIVGDHVVGEYLKDAKSEVKIYTLDGKHVRDAAFDGIGTASGFGGKQNDPETFFAFQSFATPPSIYRYNIATGEKSLLFRSKVNVTPEDYVVKQIFYESKDKTRVPMFVAHKKGVKLDGNNPTLLYGYGGFNSSQTPAFSVSRLIWMQMGGVVAIPNLRGGGEYGKEWHKAGTKLQKQNVFDDFIAAAEWLIANKYTKPAKLAVQGGSNGGLLVGAVMTQRPDLFGAALPAVGVMDMLRFHKFTAGRFWTDDYGSADNADEFKALFAYSPYHNLKKGKKYPATLVTTADTDDRVVPGHSFKFAAALQEAHAGETPVLIRIETRAGHGAGKPITKSIEEIADIWAFLVDNLDVKVPKEFAK